MLIVQEYDNIFIDHSVEVFAPPHAWLRAYDMCSAAAMSDRKCFFFLVFFSYYSVACLSFFSLLLSKVARGQSLREWREHIML